MNRFKSLLTGLLAATLLLSAQVGAYPSGEKVFRWKLPGNGGAINNGGILLPNPAGGRWGAPPGLDGGSSGSGSGSGGSGAGGNVTSVVVTNYTAAVPNYDGNGDIASVDYTLTWDVTDTNGLTNTETVTVQVSRASLGEVARKIVFEEPSAAPTGVATQYHLTRAAAGADSGWTLTTPSPVIPGLEFEPSSYVDSLDADAVIHEGMYPETSVELLRPPEIVAPPRRWVKPADTWYPAYWFLWIYKYPADIQLTDWASFESAVLRYCEKVYGAGCSNVRMADPHIARVDKPDGSVMSMAPRCNDGSYVLTHPNRVDDCDPSAPPQQYNMVEYTPTIEEYAHFALVDLPNYLGTIRTLEQVLIMLVKEEYSVVNAFNQLTAQDFINHRMPAEVQAAVNARLNQ